MGRKKGGKNPETDPRAAEVVKKVIEEGKTMKVCAEEMGVHRNTVTTLMQKAMSDDELKARVQRSRDRIVKMLSLADQAYVRILKYNHPDNFANQARVATALYKTMGLIREDATVVLNNVAFKIQVENREYTIGPAGNSDEASPQAGESVRE